MVNKIPDEYDNPIDTFIYNIIDKQLDFYYRNNFTPNKITTLSLLSGLTAAYSFYKDKYILSGILILLSHYFDCADGKFARKYNMVTELGDLYDHGSDFLKNILIIGLFYYKSKNESNKLNKFKKIIFLIIIILVLLVLFLECQEIIYNKNESKTILRLNIFTTEQCKKNIIYLRCFAPGTFNIILALIVIFWKYI